MCPCMFKLVTEKSLPLVFLFPFIPMVIFLSLFPRTVSDAVGKLVVFFKINKQDSRNMHE